MPGRVIKRVNTLGKSKRGIKYSNRVEFLNSEKQRFKWENEEVGDTLPKIEEPIYPNTLAEISGAVLESDLEDIGDAVMTPPLIV